jgi:hypothetical protein
MHLVMFTTRKPVRRKASKKGFPFLGVSGQDMSEACKEPMIGLGLNSAQA